MNTRLLKYALVASLVVLGATSCEHDNIYEPLEFSVRLAESNTYRAGEPVAFVFEGNADFITAWNGDTGHEYKHRDRTMVAVEDIESCELEVEIRQQYGDSKATENNLDIFATNTFGGLNGADATADQTVVNAVAQSDMSAWTPLAFTPNRANKAETYTYDISALADNFCFALHYHHDPAKNMRTYHLNPKIRVKVKGYPVQVYQFQTMSFVTFSLATQHATNPYVHNVTGNGNVKFLGQPNAISGSSIAFQGFNVGAMEPIDQWVFMQPMPLNGITPDTGTNIKGVADDVSTYEHIYNTPGTYTATFIVSSGNYLGESEQIVREITFTVVDVVEK